MEEKRRKGSVPNQPLNVGMTDIGLVRKENRRTPTLTGRQHMGLGGRGVRHALGGPAGGRVASQIAVSVLERAGRADGGSAPQQRPRHPPRRQPWPIRPFRRRQSAGRNAWEHGHYPGVRHLHDGGVVVTNVGTAGGHHITRMEHHPHHQGPLPGGEHGRPGDITADRRYTSAESHHPGPGTDIADCDGYICPMNAGGSAAAFRRTNTPPHQEMLFEVIHWDGEAAWNRLLAIAKAPGRAGQCHGCPDAKTVKGESRHHHKDPISRKRGTTAMRFWSVSGTGHGDCVQGQVPPVPLVAVKISQERPGPTRTPPPPVQRRIPGNAVPSHPNIVSCTTCPRVAISSISSWS